MSRVSREALYYSQLMESVNSKDYPWIGWGLGKFPFKMEGVCSGVLEEDGTTPEQRAEDLKKLLPNLEAVNKFMEQLFPDDNKARAKAIKVEEVACKDCGGQLIDITIPHISGKMYLGFIYSPDCGRGAQIVTY